MIYIYRYLQFLYYQNYVASPNHNHMRHGMHKVDSILPATLVATLLSQE